MTFSSRNVLASTIVIFTLGLSAHAQEPLRGRLAVSGSLSEDRDPGNGSSGAANATLDVFRGRFSWGASIGTDERDAPAPEGIQSLDRRAFTFAAFGDVNTGSFIWGAEAFYAAESFDAALVFDPDRPNLPAADLSGSADVTTYGLSVSGRYPVTRGDLTFTPSARLGWSRTQTEADANLTRFPVTLGTFSEDADGTTATLALATSWQASEALDFGLRLAANTASNGAAARYGLGGAGRFGRSLPDSPEDAQTWGDAEVSIGLALSSRVSLGFAAGLTEGRDIDDTFAAATLSFALGEP